MEENTNNYNTLPELTDVENAAVAPTVQLRAFMTWSLGVDMPGFSIVYAANMSQALDLLEDYVDNAQPKHQLFETYLPQELRKTEYDNAKRIHLYDLGTIDREKAGILVVERGVDVRYDD